MRGFIRTCLHELRLQHRYGLWIIYGVLVMVYVAVIQALPGEWRDMVRLVLVLTDPTALGFFFMGALVLLEKGEGVPQALATSPLRVWERVGAKVASLSSLALVAGLLVQGLGGGPIHSGMVAGLAFGALMFSALGHMVALRSPSVNGFFLRSLGPGLALALLPILRWWTGWSPDPWWDPLGLLIRVVGSPRPGPWQEPAVLMLWAMAALGGAMVVQAEAWDRLPWGRTRNHG